MLAIKVKEGQIFQLSAESVSQFRTPGGQGGRDPGAGPAGWFRQKRLTGC